MLVEQIQAELTRLQLHRVNLDVSAGENGLVLLRGSLLPHWPVPKVIDGAWFLDVLRSLPDVAGAEATMNAYCTAYTAKPAGTT